MFLGKKDSDQLSTQIQISVVGLSPSFSDVRYSQCRPQVFFGGGKAIYHQFCGGGGQEPILRNFTMES